MYFSSFDKTGFESQYVDSRKRIDILCDLIVAQKISNACAMEEYRQIEEDYMHTALEGIVLFRMIYKNRVIRLCRQFLSEVSHAV
jgi:hypothetical protein